MAEYLWSQGISGVTFDAPEDRQLLSAIWTPGVIGDGFVITAGTGNQVVVSGGYAAVADSGGGNYLGYIANSTTVAVTAGVTNNLYVQCHLTNGQTQIVALTGSTVPSHPWVFLGSWAAGVITMPATRSASMRAAAGPQTSGGIPKLAATDTTAQTQGGVWTYSQGATFQKAVKLAAGVAWGDAAVQLPGAVYYRSGAGFATDVARDDGTNGGKWWTLPLNRTGATPNTAGYGNFLGTGAYDGMMGVGADTFLAPEAGFYDLSVTARFVPSTGVPFTAKGALGLRAYASNKPGQNIMGQNICPVVEDHSGGSMNVSMTWSGHLPQGAAFLVQANNYSDQFLQVNYFEVHWCKKTGLKGGAAF